MAGIIDDALKGLETLSSALDRTETKARQTMGVIGEASRSADGLRASMSSLESASESAGDRVSRTAERLEKDATPRINDVLDLLSGFADSERYALSLMNVINGVLEGTIRAEQAFQKFGDITILWEGQMVRVDTLLREFLPTTGEVQRRIQELTKQLEDASIDEILAELKTQYGEWAKALASVVEKFRAGKVSIEAVLAVARRVKELIPDSEAGALARLLEQGLLDGSLT
ncbi:MAG: hypothetical protein K8H90_08360 [Thermoanaerobaculia bacterium]|nr:hypothetical protein [Thermoanaerobaculia bacterium]